MVRPPAAALLEAGVRSLDLTRPQLESALAWLDSGDQALAAALDALAQLPDRDPARAWEGLPQRERRDLQNTIKLLAHEQDGAEREALGSDLGERLAEAVLAAEPPPPVVRVSRSRVRTGILAVVALAVAILLTTSIGAVLWGPAIVKRVAQDPHELARVEEERTRVFELEREYVGLADELDDVPDSAPARARAEEARDALARDDLEGAWYAYRRAGAAWEALLHKVIAQERARAEVALARWAPLAEAFGLQPPQQIHRAQTILKTAPQLAARAHYLEAGLEYHEVPRLVRDGIRLADEVAPQITLTAPPEGQRTTAPTVRLEGWVRDAALARLEVDGRPVTTQPGRTPGSRRFAVDLSLPDLGVHVFEVRARDQDGRETVARRTVNREPIPLQVVVDQPGEDTVTAARTVRISGTVDGSARVTEVVVDGQVAQLDGEGHFSHEVEPSEGDRVVEVLARGPFAEGRAERRILIDRTPPVLHVQNLPRKDQTWKDRIEVQVRVEDASPWVDLRLGRLPVRRIEPGKDTWFTVYLEKGANTFRLDAVDKAGNRSSATRTVRRRTDSELLGPFQIEPLRFRVTRDLIVPPGQRLVVPKGATLQIDPGVRLTCRGELRAEGTRKTPIVIGGVGWRGIHVVGRDAQAVLKWVTVRGGRNTQGAGLHVEGGARLEAQDCLIRDCVAERNGGGVLVLGAPRQPSKVELVRVTFQSNGATQGGGLNVNTGAEATLTGCVFRGNTASKYGGGLLVIGDTRASSRLTASACLFDRNQAESGGGANINLYASGTFTRCVFSKNTARSGGGGLTAVGRLEAPTLLGCQDVRFERNVAKNGAGVIVAQNVQAVLRGGVFRGNEAMNHGGGLNAIGVEPKQLSRVTCIDVRFEHNVAKEGGGLNLNWLSRTELRGCTLESNQATKLGGGLIILGTARSISRLDCKDTRFMDNSSTNEGGGANINTSSQVRFERCRFVRNVSHSWGGGIFALSKTARGAGLGTRLELVANEFSANRSSKDQGPDLRISKGVTFDRAQLKSNGLTDPARISLWKP